MRWLVTCVAFPALAACVTVKDEPADNPFRFEGRITQGEKELKVQTEPKIGIALSGGGLRAALYSMGALRALYEKQLLQNADIISTVSGGGYTAYWLYTAQEDEDRKKGSNAPFGSARLSNEAFPKSLCESVGNGNFVRFHWMLGNAAIGRSIGLYDRRIKQVFGDRDEGDLEFPQLGLLVRQGYPHLIVNTTVISPKPNGGWKDALYEITAAGTRWGVKAEEPWGTNSEDMPYRRAVGISGAAFQPLLKQDVDETQSPSGEVTMSDGGESENLGAIALLRRGVRDIIIVDAEHNPRYEFDAYKNLQKRIKAWGGEFAIQKIDEFIASKSRKSPNQSYFSGEAWIQSAEGETKKSTIHYLKMSMPAELKESLEVRWGSPPDLANAPTEFQKFLGMMGRAWDARTRTYDCDKLAGTSVPNEAFFSFAVHSYGNWWNSKRRSRWPGPLLALNSTVTDFTATNFPQYSTGDQSMYTDQVPAFVGLGYLQALQLGSIPSGKSEAVTK